MSKTYSAADVAANNGKEAGKPLWIIIDGGVYNVSEFIEEHPGGPKILKRSGGKDVSKAFWKYHSEHVLQKYSPKLKIGEVAASAKL
ncbi:cytochrome b5 [Microthyrium microscopicum]|uniref:Cytochrome b5 n=1 Tax=Microthyrium microscopicum TaxID=703497 RepID=A0A6A6UJP4_9PEZI|nr:cytochrome b5 [Microthyrium microscopicum]